MKSDNFIRRQRHPSLVPRHAIIDTHDILPFYTIGSIVDCKSLLNLFSNNIQGILESHTIVKTSFTFIVVQIFLFLLFRFLLLVGNPRTKNADKAATHASFIQRFWVYSFEWTPQLAGPHSWFIHSFIQSCSIRYVYASRIHSCDIFDKHSGKTASLSLLWAAV